MPADAEFLKQLTKNLNSVGALEEHERLELEDIARFLERCDSAKAELVLRLTALREALTQLLRDLGDVPSLYDPAHEAAFKAATEAEDSWFPEGRAPDGADDGERSPQTIQEKSIGPFCCSQSPEGYYCTQLRGHSGPHEARSLERQLAFVEAQDGSTSSGTVYATWEKES